jgi:hypothetical protein
MRMTLERLTGLVVVNGLVQLAGLACIGLDGP